MPKGIAIEGTSATAPTAVQKLVLIAFGLVLTAVCLLLLEGALRLFRIGDEALYQDPFVSFAAGRDLFAPKARQTGTVLATTPEKLPFFNYQEFPAEKAADAYRIFTLGGSTTAGRPYNDRVSFTGWLRAYLDGMDPTRRWEVINAGAISYASYRVVLLMKELVRYSPDLFIVYTGHNEFLEERAYPPIIHQSLLSKRLWIWLNGQRSYSLTRRLARALLPHGRTEEQSLAPEVVAKPDDWIGVDSYHRNDELRRSVVEHFELNLHQMVAIARDHGADILFVVPVSNLKDFSPFKSESGHTLSPEDATRFATLLERGRDLLEAGEPHPALTVLEQAKGIDPEYAEVHFRIGEAHLSLGSFDLAYAAFVHAKDLDIVPLRALEEMITLVSRIAETYGVPFVDLPAILRRESIEAYGHAILGNEYLLDHVHPDIPVHSRIAEAILDLLVSRGVARVEDTWSESRRRAIYDRVLAAIDRHDYAVRDLNLAKVLGWAGKTKEAEGPARRAAAALPDDPEAHLNLGILLQKQQRWEEASRELEKAVRLAPESAEAHFNLGVIYAGTNRLSEGIAALQHALRLRPVYPEALYNLGILQRRAGDPEEAVLTLARALDARPDAAEIHQQLGLAYRSLERWEAAASWFQGALELQPQSAVALAGLGSVYAREQRPDEAERLLRRALAIDPTLVEAHFELGVVFAGRGKQDEAIAAYQQALRLDPGFSEALNNLGIQLAARGELDAAQDAFRRAIESDPGYAEAYFNLGVAYDGAARPRDAIVAITRALELAPDDRRFHLALGMLLQAQGDEEGARSHLRQAEGRGKPH
jgi:tetratricopeptide (TPR) repeat protein